MARNKDQKIDRIIELHFKGISNEIIAERLGLTKKYVGELISSYKKKQGDNNVQTQRTT